MTQDCGLLSVIGVIACVANSFPLLDVGNIWTSNDMDYKMNFLHETVGVDHVGAKGEPKKIFHGLLETFGDHSSQQL